VLSFLGGFPAVLAPAVCRPREKYFHVPELAESGSENPSLAQSGFIEGERMGRRMFIFYS